MLFSHVLLIYLTFYKTLLVVLSWHYLSNWNRV